MARTRRHHAEEHENHDRWLVSYADFITLLFAFFVVMYAISSVNEGKYRVLSDTMVAVFQARDRSSSVVNIGAPARTPVPNPDSNYPGAQVGDPSASTTSELEEAARDPTDEASTAAPISNPKVMARKVHEALSGLASKGIVAVTEGGEWVEVEMKSQILFDSGSAKLTSAAIPVLTEVAGAVNKFSNTLQVEGYTDNAPISTMLFPSNWELSAARAASVVHLFSKLNVDPVRMAAVGYGEFRAKVNNDTPEGRAQNRRVVVRISTRAEDHASTSAPYGTSVAPRKMQPATPAPAGSEPKSENTATAIETPPVKEPAAGQPEVKSITDRPGRESPDS